MAKDAREEAREPHADSDPGAAGPRDRPASDPAGVGSEAEQPTGGGSEQFAEEQASEVSDDLDALLADVTRERDEYLELAQRAKADFENYRKRAAREASEAERRGRAGLAGQLVPVIDNLERALAAAGIRRGEDGPPAVEQASEEVSAREAFAQGVALIFAELQSTLERAGVESFDPLGERFDPSLHEAISTRAGDGEAGTVIETLERGYRLNGQVLRPARVIVAE